MKKWWLKEEENIADVSIEIFGKKEEDLFNNLTEAFTSIITDHKNLRSKEKFSLKMTALNLEELVFNFIEKLIYLKDTKGLLFKKGKFVFKRNKKISLTSILFGQKISDNLPIKIDIKAIARHKFEVKREKNIIKTTVVFDV